jgi:hypothetical protein
MARKRKTTSPDQVAKLEDELKQRNRQIADLKRDLDKANDLVVRQHEHLRDASDMIDQWKQAFEMEQNDKDEWVWKASFTEGDEWFAKHQAIVRNWNAFVPRYNAVVQPRNVGRPLAASDAQVVQVRALRKRGMSLRNIAEETNLGLPTVRTIVGRVDGTDRTTLKHLKRIDPDRAAQRQWQAKSQSRKALPKRIAAWEKMRDELRKEAKGLK